MIESVTNIDVRYYETDLMGIVHHSNYIRYFECGRNQLLIDCGIPMPEIERRGIMLPVIDVKCHYYSPARFGDILTVKTVIDRMPMVKIEAKAEIRNQNGDLIVRGAVVLGTIDSQTRRPVRMPEFNLRMLPAPAPLATYTPCLIWHQSTHEDPFLQWVRCVITDTSRSSAKRFGVLAD